MRDNHGSVFPTVRTEGGLLPPDLLSRIVAGDSELGGLGPVDYGFPASERLGEVVSRAWSRAKAYWAAFQAAREGLAEGETGVTETRDQWMLPLFREIGYGRLEYRPAAEEIEGRRYPISHRSISGKAVVPVHVVSFRQELDRARREGGADGVRLSPHALVQEYLNRGDHLFGLVTNGLRLRVLRDNRSLTRLAFVEFDLESMMEAGVYSDFVLLFLALHRSRLPREAEAGQCWLERWRDKAEGQGIRALGELRRGVEQAITALGTGFLAHPANDALRSRLRGGEMTTTDFYTQLLRLVYRFIFLFVAEERDLLHPAGADPGSRQRYLQLYSATRVRNAARRHRADERHDDLWRGLTVTFDLLAGRRSGLDLLPLAGGLFGDGSCPDLDCAQLSNAALAEAITRLSFIRTGRLVRRVNYRDMDSEELGGVYEGLLERQPRVRVESASFELVGSGERKTTGSYYTPSSLVQELIRSALEPVVVDRLAKARSPYDKEHALLRIAVCDPACGSGHFLLAAARRLAEELARLRAGDAEPTPGQLRHALRDVIRSCIYGVDLNPLAVDLCKLALWLEGHEPGLPLAFLDHRIRVGNSLVGATPEVMADGLPDEAFDPVTGDDKAVAKSVKATNRQARKGGQLSLGMDASSRAEADDEAALRMLEVGALPDETLEQVAAKEDSYLREREKAWARRLRADAWTAAFFWDLRLEPHPRPPMSADILATASDGGPVLSRRQRAEVLRLAEEHQFFHWSLEFPEVFAEGGFDCVLGNPPWEKLEMDEQEFFAERDPEIARLPGARRKAAIARLDRENPSLWSEFLSNSKRIATMTKFSKASGTLPLTGTGRINLYALFAERDRSLVTRNGREGVIVPTGIATDDTTKLFFGDLVRTKTIVSYFGFKNEQHLFPLPVEHTVTFGILTVLGPGLKANQMEFTWFAYNVDHMNDPARRVVLTPDDLALLNPNTRTCPIFRTRVDAELTRAIYRRVPVLVNERTGENSWGVEFMQGLFNMTSDSDLFQNEPGPRLLPLYEAKLFHQYNHRWATYEAGVVRGATLKELGDPAWCVRPRYWVPQAEVEARLSGRWDPRWLLAFRNIARATDERTAIFGVIPRLGVGHSAPIGLPKTQPKPLCGLIANVSSLAFDYVVRQKLGGTNMTYGYIYQFPVLPPLAYTPADLDFIVPRVLELTYTAYDLKPFAQDLGHDGPPFPWDEERRALLRVELDAYYAALYGLNRDELRYILDPADVYGPDFPGETFRVLKNNEIKRYGEYRTRRLVLEAWDRLGLEPRNRDGRYDASNGISKIGSFGPSHGRGSRLD